MLENGLGYTKELRKTGAPEEATAGFEPASKGFADLRLTTWLCRHATYLYQVRRLLSSAI